MATKYDAAIAAMELLVKLTERPEHQLRDDEYAFKEKMFNKEVKANFVARELDFYRTKVENINTKITQLRADNNDIKNKIHASNGEIDAIPEYQQSGNATSFPAELYKGYEQNNVEMIKESWQEVQTLNAEYQELLWENEHLDKDLLSEIKRVATTEDEQKKVIENLKKQEIIGRINASNLARQIEFDKVTTSSPEDYLSAVEGAYGNVADQVETVFTVEGIKDIMETMPGYEAMSKEDKDFIAKGANLMLYNNSTGAMFLENLDNVDQSIKNFWLDPMNPYAGSMKNLLDNDYLYDKAVEHYANLYNTQNANTASNNTTPGNNNNNVNSTTGPTYNKQTMKSNRSNIQFGGKD
jgi:hypothetical protein